MGNGRWMTSCGRCTQFGLTHKRFSYQELVATESDVAGKDLAGFFHS